MGFGWGIVSEVSFIPHTVQVINPLVFPKLGDWCRYAPRANFRHAGPQAGVIFLQANLWVVLSCLVKSEKQIAGDFQDCCCRHQSLSGK